MPGGYRDRHGRSGHDRHRDRADDRGYGDVERARDEVRSWSGDEPAERRRDDQRRDREREWREWENVEFPSGPPPNREREWSSRDREWREYDRDDDRLRRARYQPIHATRRFDSIEDRYWSPYESGGEPLATSHAYETRRSTGPWGRGPKGYQRSDERINEDVCDRLTYSVVDASDIEVKVSDGEVTLSGTVPNRWHKRQAENLADVPGVRDVHNQLRVDAAAKAMELATSRTIP
jgi:hypothetical protein